MDTFKTHAEWVFSLLTTIGMALLASGSPLIGAKATLVITLALAVCTAVTRFLLTGTVPPAVAGAIAGSAVRTVCWLLVSFLLLSQLACGTVSTSTPTAPPTPAAKALAIITEVQADVKAVQTAEVAAVKAGLIEPAVDLKIQTALKQEALDATAVAIAIGSAAAPATVQAKVDALLGDLQTDVTNGALAIKDAKTQATISASIAVAEIAVNGIMGAYNSTN